MLGYINTLPLKCTSVLSACKGTIGVQYLRSGGVVESPGTGVIGGCKLGAGCWVVNEGSLHGWKCS